MRCKCCTPDVGESVCATSNGKHMAKAKCGHCGTTKCRFVSGSGIGGYGVSRKGKGFLSDTLGSIGLGVKKRGTRKGKGFLSDALSSFGLGVQRGKGMKIMAPIQFKQGNYQGLGAKSFKSQPEMDDMRRGGGIGKRKGKGMLGSMLGQLLPF